MNASRTREPVKIQRLVFLMLYYRRLDGYVTTVGATRKIPSKDNLQPLSFTLFTGSFFVSFSNFQRQNFHGNNEEKPTTHMGSDNHIKQI